MHCDLFLLRKWWAPKYFGFPRQFSFPGHLLGTYKARWWGSTTFTILPKSNLVCWQHGWVTSSSLGHKGIFYWWRQDSSIVTSLSCLLKAKWLFEKLQLLSFLLDSLVCLQTVQSWTENNSSWIHFRSEKAFDNTFMRLSVSLMRASFPSWNGDGVSFQARNFNLLFGGKVWLIELKALVTFVPSFIYLFFLLAPGYGLYPVNLEIHRKPSRSATWTWFLREMTSAHSIPLETQSENLIFTCGSALYQVFLLGESFSSTLHSSDTHWQAFLLFRQDPQRGVSGDEVPRVGCWGGPWRVVLGWERQV